MERDPGQHLAAISRLRKVCNAPSLLVEMRNITCWEEQSGKLATLACILMEMVSTTVEKAVLVSLSTSTLDLLAMLCDNHNISHCRLDGTTPPASRQGIVDQFNSTSSTTRVFLLSSKAGGTGLNLVGASRLVLYDLDWNPATDAQAMGRVWRDGQKRHCHIYRLVTTGTIEEKIYQRQVMKSGLAVGEGDLSVGQFTREELRDLFTFQPNISCDTHNLLQCNCQGAGEVIKGEGDEEEVEKRKCQLGRPTSTSGRRGMGKKQAEMAGWQHFKEPIENFVTDGSDRLTYIILYISMPIFCLVFCHLSCSAFKRYIIIQKLKIASSIILDLTLLSKVVACSFALYLVCLLQKGGACRAENLQIIKHIPGLLSLPT